jgi:hypothetical protein
VETNDTNCEFIRTKFVRILFNDRKFEMYSTVMILSVLYGHRTWPLILMEIYFGMRSAEKNILT